MFVIVPAVVHLYRRTTKRCRELREPRPPFSRVQRIIRRRPVAAFLVLAYAGLWVCLAPVVLLGAPYRPFTALGAIVGLTIPALLVTAACEGREGVRDLLRRTMRWRVPLRWHVFAWFGVPFVALLLTTLVPGTTTPTLDGAGLGVAAGFAAEVLLALVTVQLFEELAWTGFLQHRLQAPGRALRASLLVAVAFALIHLPTYFIGVPLTVPSALAVLAQMVIVVLFAGFFRVLLTWTYNRCAQSVLLVAVLHASFNTASGPAFVKHLSGGGDAPVVRLLPLVAVVALACLVAVASRGRLGGAGTAVAPHGELIEVSSSCAE